jgi:hyperosmotically inducible periplasmic protein
MQQGAQPMPDRDYRRHEDEAQRQAIMEEMEENRDRRVRDAFHSAGHGDEGPGGVGRRDPTQGQERQRPREGAGQTWPGGSGQRWSNGNHRGRGPRGYKRTDARIVEDVSDRLTEDSHVDATEIQVEAHEGEVTLTGNVDSRSARRRAEDIAEAVSGVTYVMNNLRVRQHGTSGATG